MNKVLLLGCTGEVGSRLCLKLLDEGFIVLSMLTKYLITLQLHLITLRLNVIAHTPVKSISIIEEANALKEKKLNDKLKMTKVREAKNKRENL
jgi:nucleoside-diphosphate-sugar epimerase